MFGRKRKKHLTEEVVKTYTNPTPEQLDEIVQLAKDGGYSGTTIKVDGKELDVGLEFRNKFFIFVSYTLLTFNSEEEFKEALKDIDGALAKEQDEEDKYRKDALPRLWDYYVKNHDKSDFDWDFFSDYYKDVFNHRPRSNEQIESECQTLAKELGLVLPRAELFKETPNKTNSFGVEKVLYCIFKDFNERGFHKASEGESSTASSVRKMLKDGVEETDSSIKNQVKDCINKVMNVSTDNDFIYNYKSVINKGEITTNKYDAKDFNTFCSIVTWYKRQLDKEARDIEYSEKAKAEKASGIGTEFVADKGERVTVSGIIKSKRNNGSYIIQDDKGHLIQIFSDIDVENGTKITVTGTVQRNYEFGDQKFSYLNRIKINSINEAIFTLKEGFDIHSVPGGGLQIGWIYSGNEEYEDTQYAESPKYDEQVVVKAGQKVPVKIYSSPSGIAYYAFDTTDGGRKTGNFYLYDLKKFLDKDKDEKLYVELLPEFTSIDTYPYIDRKSSLEEAKEDISVVIPFTSKDAWGREFKGYTIEDELQALIDDPDKRYFRYTDDPELIVDGKITYGYAKDRSDIYTIAGEQARKKFGSLTEGYNGPVIPAEGSQIGWIYAGDKETPVSIYPDCPDKVCYNFDGSDCDKKEICVNKLKNYVDDGIIELSPKYNVIKIAPYLEIIRTNECLNESVGVSEWGEKALLLNDIISGMNNEEAYYESAWLYVWPDGTNRDDVDDYFDTEESYNELLDTFKKVYKRYHKDGLYDVKENVLEAAHKFDKELGLSEIVDVKNDKTKQYESGIIGEVQKAIDAADDDFPAEEDIAEECDEVDKNCEKPYISVYYDSIKDAKTAYRYFKGLNQFKTVKLWSNGWYNCVLISNYTYDEPIGECVLKSNKKYKNK